MSEVTHEEFNLMLSEFYLHINRFRIKVRELSKDEALQEMMWLLEKQYRIGYDVAYFYAIHQKIDVVFGRVIKITSSSVSLRAYTPHSRNMPLILKKINKT